MRTSSFGEEVPADTLLQLVRPGEFESVLFVNRHRYRPGEVHAEHEHTDREEIFICLGGGGSLTGSFRERLSRGSIVVLGPGERHGFVSDEIDPLEYLCIGCALLPKSAPDK